MSESVAEMQDRQAEERNEDFRKEQDGIKIKDSAIDKSADNERREDRMKRLNLSDMPGHTYETEQIFKQRAEESKNEKKDYKYEANGYTVEEVEGENLLATSEEDKNKLWKVTGKDFERTFNTKRDAEIFVETHAIEFASMPATFESV